MSDILVPDTDAMHRVGAELAGWLGSGDLVLLTGELGAGKTTLAAGIGEGLGVRGRVTSPTFVIVREHPSLRGGPGLVHVDAYRLAGLEELEDLDLAGSLEESVTVVEWGHGLAEGLSTAHLELVLDRSREDGVRELRVAGTDARWAPLSPLIAALAAAAEGEAQPRG